MITRSLLLAVVAIPLVAASGAPGGTLRTLERGTYQCALPGLAGSNAVIVQEDRGFRVINASSYLKDDLRGTYLHTGDKVVFTSGDLRCVRRGE